MPNVTVAKPNEREVMQELGMGHKDYGVMYREEGCFRLLCFATRDYITIRKNPPGGSEFDSPREPNGLEKQILTENGIDPEMFEITYRDAHSIEARKCGTATYILIWKGDRKW